MKQSKENKTRYKREAVRSESLATQKTPLLLPTTPYMVDEGLCPMSAGHIGKPQPHNDPFFYLL